MVARKCLNVLGLYLPCLSCINLLRLQAYLLTAGRASLQSLQYQIIRAPEAT